MITVAEALALVLQEASPLPPAEFDAAAALGLVLAEEIASDADSPPFDKALIDGYAVRAADFTGGRATLRVLEEVVAGAVPTCPVGAGETTRVMTGAPMPEGADAVVMIEQSRPSALDAHAVELHDPTLQPGQNIMRRGASMKRGQPILAPGKLLRPVEVGLLAEVGRTRVRATSPPSVAIVSTGNELVPPGDVPAVGQIRNSNSPMLCACVLRRGGQPRDLGIARDETATLRATIETGLERDVLILSGGVSAGVLDLVPGVLRELGVAQVFHKVQLKPGKPIWFGVRRRPRRTLVFGLPGNPVSSLVCFELFVRPALEKLAGRDPQIGRVRQARLAEPFSQKGARPVYYPSALRAADPDDADPRPWIRPLPWEGSADLAGLAAADALAHFPAVERTFQKGEPLECLPLD